MQKELITLRDRLIDARDRLGWKKSDLRRAAGLKSASTLTELENGTIKDSPQLPTIAYALGVEVLWLQHGIGPRERRSNRIDEAGANEHSISLSPDTPEVISLAYSKPASDDIEIRQFNTGGSMGVGVLLRDQPGVIQSWRVSHEWLQKNVKSHSGASNLCLVTGFGDSMRPMFEPGDPLIVDTGVKTVDFDGIYFFRVDGEGFIKRLQRIPGEGIRAISENKAYESWTIRPGMDFEVFGRVLKAWKSEDY
ncbi:S24 family peptidase [Dechloromonas sp. ARDL1]|uniref:LexA family transcriptional regulator n=1 Tax=Dechloromonas sp. ARDL1 TaxID=3322121 RepID=UPI003DA6EFE9